jgi:hypothetical protein
MKKVPHVLLGAFLLLLTVDPQSWDVKCYAELYAANPEYLKVVIDTHGLPSNALLRSVRLDVAVVGTDTEDKQFWFTNGNTTALLPGKVYVQYFPLGVRGARSLRPGGKLFWSGGAAGAASCAAHPERKPSDLITQSISINSEPIVEHDSRVVGQVPESVLSP